MISPRVTGLLGRRTVLAMAAVGVLGLTACTAEVIEAGAGVPPGPPTTGPAELRLISGNNQSGPSGDILGNPLVVKVFDSTGVPFPAQPITWTVTAGNGTVVAAEAVTDAFGNAHAGWQMGDPGAQTLVVSSPNLSDVTFSATSAPVLIGIELLPETVNLLQGETQQFQAQGVFRDGSRDDVGIVWTATGGTITNNGLYTAGSSNGTFRVIARRSGGTLADTSVVSISSATATLTSVTLTPATSSVVAGTTKQFSVSGLMSDGSTIVPVVTWSATGGSISTQGLYTAGSTPGSSFRVVATAVGVNLADTSAVTVTAAPPPPPPPPPGTGGTPIFHSDWSSATGSSDAAIRDNGKATPWSARWGGQGSLNVVPATGLGFPATMTNVLRVQHYQQDFDWVMANNIWSVPAIGSAIYFRVYIRNTVDNAVDAGSSYASTHPVESEGNPNGISGGYYAMHYGSYSDGTFPFFVAMNNATYPYNGWTPGAPTSNHGGRNYDPATLVKNTTYRVEWKFTRTAANRYDFDMRIYGGDDKTLLFDRTNIYAWGGNRQTIATNGTGLSIDDSHVSDLRIGINGGFATPSPQFVYWGGFAVCSDDWCGAYSTF